MKRFILLLMFLICSVFFVNTLYAVENAETVQPQANAVLEVNPADTAFVIICTVLVMFMTPGVALFYGGMSRRKNVLGTMMQSFVTLGVATVIWVVYGYSIAFGPDIGHITGSLKWTFLNGVGLEPYSQYSSTIPHLLFMGFQMMFAVLTPALMVGAFAGRFKFKSFLLFTVIWLTIIYCPLAHWVWGDGGWIKNLGGLDFAGGLVVHISSGASALAAILVIGARRGYKREAMPPHSLPLTFIGVGILWAGWFGFNAGSALSAGKLAVSAFVATHTSAGAAVLAWMFAEWIYRGKPTVLGALSGGVAGLVAVTPAAGFVNVAGALFIGIAGGLICFFAVNMKEKFEYDDSLDVIGVHGIGGVAGAILTGIFATTIVNPDGANGSLYLVFVQIVSVVAAVVFSFVGSYIILKIIDKLFGLRVEDKEELQGLDLSQHGESGYRF